MATVEVSIIELSEHWVLVQGVVQGAVQRRYIPRERYDIQSRDPLRIEENELLGGIDACEADLVKLFGADFPLVRFDVLEQMLKEAGIWTRQDYSRNAHVIAGILDRHLRRLDASKIVSAVVRTKE